MPNAYADLYMERLDFDNNYLDVVGEHGKWGTDKFAPFIYITVGEVEGGLKYRCAMYVQERNADIQALTEKVRHLGYTPDGFGWAKLLREHISTKLPEFNEYVNYENDAQSCVLFINNSIERFYIMLTMVSGLIRELCEP